MTSSPRASICCAKSSASGETASGGTGCRALRGCLGAGGRPAFPPRVVVAVKALACELPAPRGLPLARWSLSDLQQAVVAQGLVAQISGATLWRWLSQDALRPWRHRSWIFPRDPAFAAKAERLLELYAGRWDGVSLGPRDYVLSADEKTSVQARLRIHPSLAPAAGRPMYVGSSHRGERARARLRATWPRLVLVHTPVHASWLNQIEIYFSIVQRKVLTPNDFVSLAEVEDRLLRFQDHYERAAAPFQWTFTRQDLAALLAKLAAKHRLAAA